MTTSAMHVPRFVAVTYDGECVEADDELAVVLDALAKTFDPDDPEELVVWRDGQTVAAVQRADGTVTLFEQPQALPARKPPARPSNGKARRR